jgi:hypothetical protein
MPVGGGMGIVWVPEPAAGGPGALRPEAVEDLDELCVAGLWSAPLDPQPASIPAAMAAISGPRLALTITGVIVGPRSARSAITAGGLATGL